MPQSVSDSAAPSGSQDPRHRLPLTRPEGIATVPVPLGPGCTAEFQDPVPDGTPAALDPTRITGYRYRYPGAADTGAEYLPTCTAGWCTLRCPLEGCPATIAFPAAPTQFTIPAVPLTTADCGTGTVGSVVDRDLDGVVLITIARDTSTTTQVC